MFRLARIIFITFLLCSILRPGLISGQDMYPGDVNDNGIANAVDLLYLGIAYGAMGPERDDGDTEWEPQMLPSTWGQSFPGGLDYAYADCDGDGTVDDEDIDEAISENFGLTHGILMPDGYNTGPLGSAPVLALIPDTDIAQEGATVSFDIVLGSEDNPITDFYGLAFTMTYESEFTEEEDDIELNLVNNSWIDPTNGSLSRSLIVFEEDGHAEIAITRINQQAIENGFGTIATFSIVIEDDIASNEIDTMDIAIDSVLLIGPGLTSVTIAPRDTFVLIDTDTALSDNRPEFSNEIKLFPNPVINNLLIVNSPVEIKEVSIYNTLGQLVKTHFPNYNFLKFEINLGADKLPQGLYFLQMKTSEGILSKQFIIHN